MKKTDNKIEDGPFVEHFKNGQVSVEGCYSDGKKTGEWIFYNEDGSLT